MPGVTVDSTENWSALATEEEVETRQGDWRQSMEGGAVPVMSTVPVKPLMGEMATL